MQILKDTSLIQYILQVYIQFRQFRAEHKKVNDILAENYLHYNM